MPVLEDIQADSTFDLDSGYEEFLSDLQFSVVDLLSSKRVTIDCDMSFGIEALHHTVYDVTADVFVPTTYGVTLNVSGEIITVIATRMRLTRKITADVISRSSLPQVVGGVVGQHQTITHVVDSEIVDRVSMSNDISGRIVADENTRLMTIAGFIRGESAKKMRGSSSAHQTLGALQMSVSSPLAGTLTNELG